MYGSVAEPTRVNNRSQGVLGARKQALALAKGALTRREATRPDRFSAKCRRVLHAAIMVEIYVANISSHPFLAPSASPAAVYMKRSCTPA